MTDDQSSATGGSLPWTPQARAYVQFEQERLYRTLANSLGLGSDPAKAYALLSGRPMPSEYASPEKLRHELGDRFSITPEQWEGFDKTHADLMKRYFELEPPTQYEDPNWYRSMALTLGTLRESFDIQGQSPVPNPLLATLPSGDVNARILIIPGGNVPVIFFEQGLFQFFYDFSLVASWAMPSLSPWQMADDTVLAQLSPAFEIPEHAAAYFYESVHAYVVKGSARANGYSLDRPAHNLFVGMALLQEVERFVMAHELAHFTKGHLQHTPENRDEGWLQEYEADEIGLTILSKRAADSVGSWAIATWACDVALGLFHLLSFAAAIVEHGTDELRWISKTHPPSLYRQRNLRQKMISLVPNFSWTGLNAVSALDNITQAMLNELWGLIRLRFLDAHKRGIRPSPIWKEQIEFNFASRAGGSK